MAPDRIGTHCSSSVSEAPRKTIGIRWPFRGNRGCPKTAALVSETNEPLSLWFLLSVAVHEKNLFMVNTNHARDRSSTVPWYRRGTVPWDRTRLSHWEYRIEVNSKNQHPTFGSWNGLISICKQSGCLRRRTVWRNFNIHHPTLRKHQASILNHWQRQLGC